MYAGRYFYIKENNNYVKLENLVIPEGVKEIPDYAFLGFNCITNIQFPSSLEAIGECAFVATFIQSVEIPDSVTYIGNGAFKSCIYLNDIKLSKGLKEISSDCFQQCLSLVSIEIPDNVERIDDAFYDCNNLKILTLPASIKYVDSFGNQYINKLYYKGSIEQWCNIEFHNYWYPIKENGYFYMLDENNQWYEVKKIVLPTTITKIDAGRFSGMASLEEIVMSSYITSIGQGAFANCINLKEINLPDDLTTIESSAFFNCKSLTKVDIPSTSLSIKSKAFGNCTSLKDVILDGELFNWFDITFEDKEANPLYYGENFYLRINNEIVLQENIEIPLWITSIGAYQFVGCSNIKTFYIHGNVKNIGNYAFANCHGSIINCQLKEPPETWSSTWNSSNCNVNCQYHKEN